MGAVHNQRVEVCRTKDAVNGACEVQLKEMGALSQRFSQQLAEYQNLCAMLGAIYPVPQTPRGAQQ